MPLIFTRSYYPGRVRVFFPEGEEIKSIDFDNYARAENYISSKADSSLERFYVQRQLWMQPSLLRDKVTGRRAGYIEWIVEVEGKN